MEEGFEAPPKRSTARSETRAWITGLYAVVCIVVWGGLNRNGPSEATTLLPDLGYRNSLEIWGGAYWALLTSAYLHVAIWHLAFNVYWLWELGNRMERAIGRVPFLAFILGSAALTSAYQLGLGDAVGIGASGVVYAIFGFMWGGASRYPVFREVITTRIVRLFVVWAFGCLAITLAGIFSIGNAAHFSGLIFGLLVAGAFRLNIRPRLQRAALLVLVLLAILSLFWCPWSVIWTQKRAYDLHLAQHYEEALPWYDRVIRLDPENVWAYRNRAMIFDALGKPEQSADDLATAERMEKAGK